MPSFDPQSKWNDGLRYCQFPKHQGKSWVDVIEEDPDYIEWLMSGEGPKISNSLYDYLMNLLEGEDEEDA